MSRTYRKPKWVLEESKETYVKRNAERKRYIREYYITPENEKRYLRDLEEYEVKYATYLKGFPVEGGFYSIRKPYHHDYMSYNKICISDYETEVKEAEAKYSKFTRDGWWNETGRNTLYKKWSKKLVRNANRRLEHKILKDDDYDHLPYPDYYMAKPLIWSIW